MPDVCHDAFVTGSRRPHIGTKALSISMACYDAFRAQSELTLIQIHGGGAHIPENHILKDVDRNVHELRSNNVFPAC